MLLLLLLHRRAALEGKTAQFHVLDIDFLLSLCYDYRTTTNGLHFRLLVIPSLVVRTEEKGSSLKSPGLEDSCVRPL